METTSTYIQGLKSSDSERREKAARALYDLGDAARCAVPALLDTLLRETHACPWIGTAIVKIGPSEGDIPKLREAINSPHHNTRFWAARAIVKLGPSGAPLIDDLIASLGDDEHTVYASVTWALASIGEQAIPKLIANVEHEDALNRSRTLIALSHLTKYATVVLPILAKALDDNERLVRSSASRAVCGLAQDGHGKADMFNDLETRELRKALERVCRDEENSLIDIEPDWPRRVLRWMSEDN